RGRLRRRCLIQVYVIKQEAQVTAENPSLAFEVVSVIPVLMIVDEICLADPEPAVPGAGNRNFGGEGVAIKLDWRRDIPDDRAVLSRRCTNIEPLEVLVCRPS